MKTLLLGLGDTGQSVIRYFARKGKLRSLIAFDTRSKLDNLAFLKKTYAECQFYLQTLPDNVREEITLVIKSPGVSSELAILNILRQKGIPIIGDIELFAREVKKPVIAITGTNGKSTVTSLVGEMVKAAGFSPVVAGNIGLPALDTLHQTASHYVLELSSFQLDTTLNLKPEVACLLNISPDHLDRYSSYDSYICSKKRVFQNAHQLIYNVDEVLTIPEANNNRISFSIASETADWHILNEKGQTFLAYRQKALFPVSKMKLKGMHNCANALSALAIGQALGLAHSAMFSVLENYAGLAFRCQWVRTLEGVAWYNDSKGTNVGATISAIAGLGRQCPGKLVLIAGGQGKGADFEILRESVARYVKAMLLFGEDALKIEKAVQGTVPILQMRSLEEAILKARNLADPPDMVLFSPACASFDMFKNYSHRGECFTHLVESLR